MHALKTSFRVSSKHFLYGSGSAGGHSVAAMVDSCLHFNSFGVTPDSALAS